MRLGDLWFLVPAASSPKHRLIAGRFILGPETGWYESEEDIWPPKQGARSAIKLAMLCIYQISTWTNEEAVREKVRATRNDPRALGYGTVKRLSDATAGFIALLLLLGSLVTLENP